MARAESLVTAMHEFMQLKQLKQLKHAKTKRPISRHRGIPAQKGIIEA